MELFISAEASEIPHKKFEHITKETREPMFQLVLPRLLLPFTVDTPPLARLLFRLQNSRAKDHTAHRRVR